MSPRVGRGRSSRRLILQPNPPTRHVLGLSARATTAVSSIPPALNSRTSTPRGQRSLLSSTYRSIVAIVPPGLQLSSYWKRSGSRRQRERSELTPMDTRLLIHCNPQEVVPGRCQLHSVYGRSYHELVVTLNIKLTLLLAV